MGIVQGRSNTTRDLECKDALQVSPYSGPYEFHVLVLLAFLTTHRHELRRLRKVFSTKSVQPLMREVGNKYTNKL